MVITGERGQEGQLTRFGIEEYVSDCVVALDHRVEDEVSTRRLRVVKDGMQALPHIRAHGYLEKSDLVKSLIPRLERIIKTTG